MNTNDSLYNWCISNYGRLSNLWNNLSILRTNLIMNAHSRKLVKPGDTFIHVESGDVYKLLKTKKEFHRGENVVIYHFLDIKTDQVVEYTWKMFRGRLKYAPPQAQILYNDQDSEIKTAELLGINLSHSHLKDIGVFVSVSDKYEIVLAIMQEKAAVEILFNKDGI